MTVVSEIRRDYSLFSNSIERVSDFVVQCTYFMLFIQECISMWPWTLIYAHGNTERIFCALQVKTRLYGMQVIKLLVPLYW